MKELKDIGHLSGRGVVNGRGRKMVSKAYRPDFSAPEPQSSYTRQAPSWESWNVPVRKRRLLRNQLCLLDSIPTEESWAVTTCSASERRGKRDLGLSQLRRAPSTGRSPWGPCQIYLFDCTESKLWHVGSSMWRAGSSVVECKLLLVACRI